MKRLAILFLALIQACISYGQDDLTLLIGTYTGTGSEGIYSYRLNQATGDCTPLAVTRIDNPSFLTISSDSKTVFSVTEQQEDASVSAFELDARKGTLTLKDTRLAFGKDPCHVTFLGSEIVATNYSSGSLISYSLDRDGSLGNEGTLVEFSGWGPVEDRQEGSHIHSSQVSPDGKYLFVIDLGGDRIYRYPVEGGRVASYGKQMAIPVPPGEGPRHFTFSNDGRFMYVLTELGGNVLAYAYEGGNLRLIQKVEADPLHASGSADIHFSPDGSFLYASNRLEGDGLAIFRQDRETGKLSCVGYQKTGIHPRNFAITPNGQLVLVACRDSDIIQVFRRNPESGLLKDTGKDIKIPRPVCVLMTPSQED